MNDMRRLRIADELVDSDNKETMILGRFDQARGNGASERTALKIAAWAWLEWHPGGTILEATREARRFLTRNGRRISPAKPTAAWIG